MDHLPKSDSQVDPDWYRGIVETSPDATVMIDADGRIMLVNQQTERLFGYERQDLLGKRIEILVPDGYRDQHQIHRDGYFADPKVREMGGGSELLGRRKDGREFPVEISLSPLRAHKRVFVIASVRDATARRRSQEQIRNLLETAPDAMVIIDQEGRIRLVNRQTETLFGYRREALVGKPVEVQVPERLRDRHQGHRTRYFETPKVRGMGAGLELAGRRKDGREFPIEISLSPLETAEGTWATAAVRDVTERKATEDKLQAYAESLEQSNRELEQFAYIASHDLQAPLRNVISFTQLLARELKPAADTPTAEYMGFIEEGAQRMHGLVRDILAVSRVERQGAPFTRFSLQGVVERVVRELQPEIEAAGGTVRYDRLPSLHGDATQIGQVLQNLVGNAIKFRRPDRPPEIRIEVETAADAWTVAIDDNGIGIEESERSEVFKIFYRLHTDQQYPGTGIGLAICKRIVERHGGTIAVLPSASGGSRFVFSVSRRAGETSTAAGKE